jgi:integrase
MSEGVRRDKGSGSVYQRASDGLWVGYVTLPDGPGRKRRRKVVTAKAKGTVVDKLRVLRKDLDRTGDLTTSSPTLATWLTLWLDTIKAPRLKPRTLTGYRGYVDRYIVPTLGRKRLDKLTPDHVRDLHNAITGQGLSTTTALQAHRILAKALTDAMREGRVTRNVATLLDAPTRARAVRPALTADDARALLVSVAGDPAQAVHWSIALLAGLRQGERLGLTRDMIDLDAVRVDASGTVVPAPFLTVAWQIQRLKWAHGCGKRAETWPCGKRQGGACPQRAVFIPADQEAHQVYGGLWLTRPKSLSGWRQVPLAPQLAAILRLYLKATPPGDHGLILTRPDGHPVDPRDDAAAWDAALRAAGLPDVPLHSARHTCATLLQALGIDEQTRMDILGHSAATTTRGYTHITGAVAADAIGRLGTLLGPRIEG